MCRYRRRWSVTEDDDEVDRNEIYKIVVSRVLNEVLKLKHHDSHPAVTPCG